MRSGDAAPSPLEALAEEIRLAFRQFKAVDATHEHGGITAAQRDVVEQLYRRGDQRVPELARARGVSRQHVLELVTRLIRLGWIDARFNPSHQRSPVVDLSEAGRRRYEELRESERAVFSRAHLPVSDEHIRHAVETLRLVRTALGAVIGSARVGRRRRASDGRAPRRR